MCHLQTPFLTQVKFLGTYGIPKIDVDVAATYQSLPGPLIAANYVATNAEVQPSLGRPLSGGAANATVNIVAPGTMYGERANSLDLRFAQGVPASEPADRINFDLYNVFNSNAVLSLNSAYARWQVPLSILNATAIQDQRPVRLLRPLRFRGGEHGALVSIAMVHGRSSWSLVWQSPHSRAANTHA